MQTDDKNTDRSNIPIINRPAEERATKSNAIDIPSISLPKGGGAIKGIDEKFQVNPSNGTASFSIPLPISPNRNGFTPSLSISYNSGAGNSILGIGWGLDFPSIQRKTDKRLPRYFDGNNEEDTFMFSGAEDLVPYLKREGDDWQLEESTDGYYSSSRYRPRVEGGFARIERILHPENGMYWRVTTRENVTTLFGRSPACRIADPEDPRRIFQWLPELSFDDKGSVVVFEYKAEDLANVPNEVWEKNRSTPDRAPRFANRYLKRIQYGNRLPVFPYPEGVSPYDPQVPGDLACFFELVFDYGDHHPDTPTPLPDRPWLHRPDPFSEYRAGFEIRTQRLLRRALLFHHFEELNGGMPTLVRSLDFQFVTANNPARECETELEFLEHIFQTSYVWIAAENRYSRRSLPPMSFEYQALHWNQEVRNVREEDLMHAPAGLAGNYQFTDLYGEGINGILTEQGNAWHYKYNLGDTDENGYVTFTPAQLAAPKPSFTGLATGVLQLQDLDADGGKQLVVAGDGVQGYFELNDNNTWENFRAFENRAVVDLQNPNVRLLDLNGDGRPEIVLSEENAFRWWGNKGRAGYEADERTFKPFDEELGPAIVFSDPEQRIFLADMSGDGLTDIVRIRNGEVCYWPNRGYGHFGRKVTMGNAPLFDTQDQFNPGYLQLADISGTGASDLIYLGENRCRAWLNLSGNRWGAEERIEPFSPANQPNQITVTDLLGHGTGCLVWSSPLPGEAQNPMRYIDLMGGKKPHIMTAYHNNLGKTVRMEYRSSTWFYLNDKQAGNPWITKLPFPVQVVEKTEVEDTWRKTLFASTYSYHHGYYDHAEREFRGFGRVEQTDVEDFGAFVEGNAASPYISDDLTLYQPPVKTITWFHTGAFLSRERILNQFEHEYFRPDSGDFRENRLPEPDLEAAGLSAVEYREALRACKGMALRTEVYELNVDALAARQEHLPTKLFSAAFHNCHIQRLQPQGPNPHAVFLVTESEAITYHYELDLRQSELHPDPRIAHTLNLDIDELGNVLQSVAVAYPRWRNEVLNDPLLPEVAERLIQDVQNELHIVYTENRFTDDVITQQDYRLRIPCEIKTYELSGVVLAEHSYFARADFPVAPLQALTPTAYHRQPASGLQKRMVEHVRMLHFAEDLRNPLPLGQLNRLGLPYETYKIALTEDLLEDLLGDKLPALQETGESLGAMRRRVLNEGGYHQFDGEPGLWWIRSGIAGFADDASAYFYLPERYTDPFGNTTVLTYDPYDLFIQNSRDPLGNEVEVMAFDYRVLTPVRMRDPNDNLSEVAFDILGLPAAMALLGKGEEGDNLHGVLLDLDETAIRAFFTGEYNEAQARIWLGNATARHIYYLGDAEHPACAAGMLREKHVAQLAAGEISPIQIAFEYSDGSGQVIAAKTQAEPETPGGPARWITNGKTILNNKGKPVKQYEPYFTDHHRYAEPDAMGVTPIIYYDAAGRTVRTEMPDGTYNRVEFSPWFMAAWDANDTVLEAGNAWYARYSRGTPEEQRAARLAAVHAHTPAVTHLDSLGREVIAIAHNRWQRDETRHEEKYLTYTQLDAEGKPLWIRDARGNRVMEYINPPGADTDFSPCYDLAGNLLFQHSMDGGERWMLPDTSGQPMYVWDENEVATEDGSLLPENRIFHTRYDALRRPLEQRLRTGAGSWQTTERFVYGETALDAHTLNLRGQPYRHYDPSGLLTHESYDFKGNLRTARKQLAQTYDAPVLDWSDGSATGRLSLEIFTQNTRYDALNRMIRLENWHLPGREAAVYQPHYNRRGLLFSETLSIRSVVQEAIRGIDYNAKSQRTRIQYGDRSGGILTTTRYHYDPNTFRLLHLLTTARSGTALLQDLHYTYDPSGNIAQIEDRAQDDVFFRNRHVKPVQAYEYDALYRLTRADGRENVTNTAPGPGPHPFGPLDTTIPGDGALRAYTQRYLYDAVGNFIAMQHIADDGSWTRHYETAPGSNRLLRTWLGDDEPGVVRYRYDIHGSMLNFANTPEANNHRWDYRDMIHSLDLIGGGQSFYQYDAQKQRTRKRIVRNTNEYWERLYLGGYELYRRYVGGVLTEETETHHLFADEQRILIVEDMLVSVHRPPSTVYRFQYSNHLGSVGLECDGSGQIISYEEYHPYGTAAYQARNAEIQAAAKRYRYTGMERDEESGLAYHTARYYLAWLGRWGSCDPIGMEGGMNFYEYTYDNPINNFDISGLGIFLTGGAIEILPNDQAIQVDNVTARERAWVDFQNSHSAEEMALFEMNQLEDGRGQITLTQRGREVLADPSSFGGHLSSGTRRTLQVADSANDHIHIMPVPVFNSQGNVDIMQNWSGQQGAPRLRYRPNGSNTSVIEWLGLQGHPIYGRTAPATHSAASTEQGGTEEIVIYATRFANMPISDPLHRAFEVAQARVPPERPLAGETYEQWVDRQSAITQRHEIETHATRHVSDHNGLFEQEAERLANRYYLQRLHNSTLAVEIPLGVSQP